jgi:hypothetical protein
MICCERNVVLADKLEDAKTKVMTDESRHRPWPRQVPTLRSKFIGLACTTTDQWPTYLEHVWITFSPMTKISQAKKL